MKCLALTIAMGISITIFIIGCIVGSISEKHKFLLTLADTLTTIGSVGAVFICLPYITLPITYVLIALIIFIIMTIIGGILSALSEIDERLKYPAQVMLWLGSIESIMLGIAWLIILCR